MTRQRHGRKHGDRNGYVPPDRILDERDAAAERRQAQPPAEDPPRGNQQVSNAGGRAPEPANNTGRAPEPANNTGHRGGPAPHGNHGGGRGGSRPPQTHGHGRPHDARGRRQNKVAQRPKVTCVPEMKIIDYVNAQGKTVATRAVNSSQGGGPQNDIIAPKDRGFLVAGTTTAAADQAINMGLANGASGYVASIDFVYNNDVAKARKNHLLEQHIESSSGRQGPRPRLRLPAGTYGKGRPLAERVTQPGAETETQPEAQPETQTVAQPVVQPASDPRPEPQPSTEPDGRVVDMGNMGQYQCANCGGSGHNMDWCLNVPEGLLHGCTLCHSTSHCVDDCRNFRQLTLQQQVKLLVYDRYSLPALETKMSWFDWLRQWLAHPDSRDQERSAAVPSGYPWSEAFTSTLARGEMPGVAVDALQAEFDGHKDVSRLPKDPATADFDAVHRTYGDGHIYPDQPSTLRKAKDGKFSQPAPVKKAGPSTEVAGDLNLPTKTYFEFDIEMDTSST